MKRIVKRQTYCKHCRNQLTPPKYSWFCDYCKKLICDENHIPKENGGLEVTVFFKNASGKSDAIHLEICSYKCLRQWLIHYNPKKPVWFVTLPDIQADDPQDWTHVRDTFLKEFMNDNPSVR